VANLGYHNSETLEPIVTKFGMGDYVGDITPHAEIQINHHIVGVLTNR